MDVHILDPGPFGSDRHTCNRNWSDVELFGIWQDMFVASVCCKLKNENKDVQGILMLLETALENVKSLGSRWSNLLVSYNTSIKKLRDTEDECNQLKTSLRSLKNSSCDKCPLLKNELKEAKQRADDAETRMNSIAKILRLGDADEIEKNNCDVKSNCNIGSDDSVTIVSQILSNKPPTSKRKRSGLSLEKEINIAAVDDNGSKNNGDEVLVVATLDASEQSPLSQPAKNLATDMGEQIPETPLTPWKHNKRKSSTDDVKSPEKVEKSSQENTQKLKLRLSNSVNIPPNSNNKHGLPPKRNLSTDFTGNLEMYDSAKNSDVETGTTTRIKRVIVNNEEAGSSGSLVGCIKGSNTELDKIWFDSQQLSEEEVSYENKSAKRSPKKGGKKASKSMWKLRQNKGPDKSFGQKRLKQTTLEVANKSSTKDITQMENFKGGKLESSDCNVVSDDDDIVLPSPKQKKYRKRQERNDKFDSVNLSLFAPVATSTQLLKEELNTSYDRIPVKEKSKSPNYKYKRETVRGKAARAKLEGRECEDCIKYYKATGQDLSPSKLKERINACSRHKQQELRCKTPPGFWDPLMPSTEECRDRGMYTSIYCLKDTNK